MQFNADMNHIALNIFDTFTLFDLVKQGSNHLNETIQEIEYQKAIVDSRVDNIENKLEEIET